MGDGSTAPIHSCAPDMLNGKRKREDDTTSCSVKMTTTPIDSSGSSCGRNRSRFTGRRRRLLIHGPNDNSDDEESLVSHKTQISVRYDHSLENTDDKAPVTSDKTETSVPSDHSLKSTDDAASAMSDKTERSRSSDPSTMTNSTSTVAPAWKMTWTATACDITSTDEIVAIYEWFHYHATSRYNLHIQIRNQEGFTIEHRESPNFLHLGAALLINLHFTRIWQPIRFGRMTLHDVQTVSHPRSVQAAICLLDRFQECGPFRGKFATSLAFIQGFNFGGALQQLRQKFKLPRKAPIAYYKPDKQVFTSNHIHGVNIVFKPFLELMQAHPSIPAKK